jgi:hypothetical protein
MPNTKQTSEDILASRIVAVALEHLGDYTGPWRADWLDGPAIGVSSWKIRTRRSREAGGETLGDGIIRWDIQLPNGTRLDSQENTFIQHTAQKIAFLARQLPGWGIRATSTHINFISDLHFVIRWLFEYDRVYRPAEYAFELLDEDGLDAMFHEYIEGGAAGALHFQQKIIYKLCSLALPNVSVEEFLKETDIFRLDKNITIPVISWLRENHFYDSVGKRDKAIPSLNRARLCELISFDPRQIISQKCNALLRQFEPELLKSGGPLLIPTNTPRTEFFHHKTVLLEDARDSKCSSQALTGLTNALRIVFGLSSKIKNGCPRNRLDIGKYYNLAETEGSPNRNTPLMPLEVAVPYATESIRWISRHAEPLIDFYLTAASHFKEFELLNSSTFDPSRGEKREKRNKWIAENMPTSLAGLNISRWGTVFHNAMTDPHEHLRTSPGLHDLIDVLVGAILYILIETCDLREGEIEMLTVDSLEIKEQDGYWIRRNQEKQHVLDKPVQKTRPCPNIVARGLFSIKRLRCGLLKLRPTADPFISEALFYLPDSAHNSALTAAPLNRYSLQRCLEVFCDYVALPADEYGRRWYVRPHECRKSCLVTFFSCTGFAALDTARWMSGHRSLNSILIYLKKNTPKDRFLAMEAQLASAELWRVEQKSQASVLNAEDLYRHVCERFRVRSISAISQEDLNHWLTDAFRGNIYAIEITSRDNALGEVIAFIIGDKHGDED